MTTQQIHRQPPRWRSIFDVCSTMAMLILAATLVWQGRGRFFDSPAPGARSRMPGPPIPSEPIKIDESVTLGASSARVAIIEYADFECSACADFAAKVKPALVQEYIDTKRARLVFKNFPLRMHRQAAAAAAAAWCASRERKFWQVHDWLFASPANLDNVALQAPPGEFGLDLTTYNSCRSGTEAAQQIEADRSVAEALEIPATPTFYFGRVASDGRVQVSHTLMGAMPTEAFRTILNRLLK